MGDLVSKLIQKRDEILESLRIQFRAKIESITFTRNPACVGEQSPLDAFLRDLANNLAQGLCDDDDERCPNCGIGPLHASESDDLGRCAPCAGKVDDGDSNATLGLRQGVQNP